LINESAKEIRVAKSDVSTIERQREDGVRNGVLIGSTVGFGAGFFALEKGNSEKNLQVLNLSPIIYKANSRYKGCRLIKSQELSSWYHPPTVQGVEGKTPELSGSA
jgi:hypothetical protein